jgi:hypothetical protein
MSSTAMKSSALTAKHDFQSRSLKQQVQIKWQEGDWEFLCKINRKEVESQSERAQIAPFIAAAHQQLDHTVETICWTECALSWGTEKAEIAHILLAGIYNTLGRLAALQSDQDCMVSRFRVATSLPNVTENLMDHKPRMIRELCRIGLLDQGVDLVQLEIRVLDNTPSPPLV